MKTQTRWTTLSLVASALIVAFMMNACGSKNNGGGGGGGPMPPYDPAAAGCLNCPAGSAVVATAFGTHNPQTISVGVTFFSQGPINPAVGTYSGPVTGQGELFVGPQAGSSFCPVPPGVYPLVTVQPGQWMNSLVSGLRMEAQGPARISVVLIRNGVYPTQPMIQYNGRNYPNRMWGDVMIESVNGQPCQPQLPYFVQ